MSSIGGDAVMDITTTQFHKFRIGFQLETRGKIDEHVAYI